MKSGQYVCTDVPAYAGEWPQIGKVISMQPDTVTLQWYKGSKTTTWKPCTKRVKGTKGKTEAWEENVERCYIWSEGFNLTSTGHLPKKNTRNHRQLLPLIYISCSICKTLVKA